MSHTMNAQIVGNVGLYYVCYELSKRGWNVMPTARNARGVDIIAYNLSATHYVGIQVKALSSKSPVPLGNSLDRIMGDYWIIVNNLASVPSVYVLKPEEVRLRAHRGEKETKVSFWLQPKGYALPEFEARWDRLQEPIKNNSAPASLLRGASPTPAIETASAGSLAGL